MKTKVLYIFAFMLVLDMLSSCNKTDIFTVEINRAFIKVKNYATNRTLFDKDEVPATDLEAFIALSFVQVASNFEIPSLFSTSAYAKKDKNLYNFSNRLVKVSVFTADENGLKKNITDKSTFLYSSSTYSAQAELVNALNARLDRYGVEDTGTPSLGYKIRFDSSIQSTALQSIRVEMEWTDRVINVNSVLLEIK